MGMKQSKPLLRPPVRRSNPSYLPLQHSGWTIGHGCSNQLQWPGRRDRSPCRNLSLQKPYYRDLSVRWPVFRLETDVDGVIQQKSLRWTW
jgi:hypothetical protein